MIHQSFSHIALILFSVFIFCSEESTGPGQESSEKYNLTVLTNPVSAQIFLDGKDTGFTTPHTFNNLPLKNYFLEVLLYNYKVWQDSIFIQTDQKDTTVYIELTPECPGRNIGDINQYPGIAITYLSNQPGNRIVKGVAENIDAREIKVVLWAKTDKWYVQPLISDPYTVICGDGSWENWTHPWTQMVALLVDSSYNPGATRLYHPSNDPGVLAWDEQPIPAPDRIIDFSGYPWRVKQAEKVRVGPGPNYFSDSTANVWIDSEGLHLKLDFRDNKWFCAEVVLNQSLGYGEYTFQLSSRVDALDYNAVFAGFIYESTTREFDMEFSRALAAPQNAQYVVQPFCHSGNLFRFQMPAETLSSHRFLWRADSIVFISWRGHEAEPAASTTINSWRYEGADIPPPGGERMRFNLWLFQGNAAQTKNQVIVKSFGFKPF